MSFEDSWHVIRQAAAENRHELVLSGSAINELLQRKGLDRSLFELRNLNYLNISQTCLRELPDEVEKLLNLTTLVLHTNELTKIPSSISKLEKLKVLDCSRNKLTDLPEELRNLPQITTMNFGSNLLSSLPSQALNVKLSVLNLSNNQFEEFPDVCYPELVHLSEIYVNGNKIKEVPTAIGCLESLKILNLVDNLITVVPGELTNCFKLKELSLKGNKLTDKRLLKLVEQCSTKQIMEYLRVHCSKNNSDNPKGKTKKGSSKKDRKNQKYSEFENTENDVDALCHQLRVLKTTNNTPSIEITAQVKNVRGYIAACIVRNLFFTEDIFKAFIQLQSKLHDGICEKRNAATIATHDLNLIAPGDMLYTAMPPNELEIIPLARDKSYTGVALFQQLQAEAENLRKEKKHNIYSGIHKYLYLLEGKSLFPCLLDAQKRVISFPPITNSKLTKISLDTKEMLIEVTSATSYNVCRNVLDEFLKKLILLGVSGPAESEATSEFHNLVVEQVKIVDMDGNMKLVYPSRADLHIQDGSIIVTRE